MLLIVCEQDHLDVSHLMEMCRVRSHTHNDVVAKKHSFASLHKDAHKTAGIIMNTCTGFFKHITAIAMQASRPFYMTYHRY